MVPAVPYVADTLVEYDRTAGGVLIRMNRDGAINRCACEESGTGTIQRSME